MRRKDGIAYLTQCADRQGKHWHGGFEYPAEECRTCDGTNYAGHLRTFSRYGRNGEECAPVAWRLAYLYARELGTEVDLDALDYAMDLVVNDSESVADMVREYGGGKYS